ncbi:Protein FAM117B [Sciurus carolinensis]|uniref:Protein FAM117B n=1 Tax=Sciurus carolinensis TaxID=30640 RepID=A0AA41NEE6_SCICA|nr:Protein FAM117B [Sciurus carolinensis]
MSQRVRRNGSPTPAGALGGGAVATAGGPGSRLQPMRATVPFQLKQQQQHGSPTRSNGGGGGGNNNGSCCGGASGPSGGGGGGPRTASRSTSPTRGSGSTTARTSPTVATQTGASATSTRGTSPTRGAAPGARGSPPRPQPPPPPPLLGTVSSPCSSPTHLWTSEVSAAPPPARVRHRRRSPEQSRPSPEKRSPSAPVCKAGTCGGREAAAGKGLGDPRRDCGATAEPGAGAGPGPGAGPPQGAG